MMVLGMIIKDMDMEHIHGLLEKSNFNFSNLILFNYFLVIKVIGLMIKDKDLEFKLIEMDQSNSIFKFIFNQLNFRK
jgi:hypothetical protein